jgi:hypothetical protein
MCRPLSRACCAILALLMPLLARPTHAQSVRPLGSVVTDSACSYRTCALTIAPRWNGLAVLSGGVGPQVANLHFPIPRDITPALAGPDATVVGADSAATHARHAMRLRRTGAVLTDIGLLLGAAAALHALRDDRHRRRDATVAGVGGAFLLLSIPFQFAADGALSRAVWWHNVRYAR